MLYFIILLLIKYSASAVTPEGYSIRCVGVQFEGIDDPNYKNQQYDCYCGYNCASGYQKPKNYECQLLLGCPPCCRTIPVEKYGRGNCTVTKEGSSIVRFCQCTPNADPCEIQTERLQEAADRDPCRAKIKCTGLELPCCNRYEDTCTDIKNSESDSRGSRTCYCENKRKTCSSNYAPPKVGAINCTKKLKCASNEVACCKNGVA